MSDSVAAPRYVYGVVRASRARPDGRGIRDEALEVIVEGDVGALASEAPEEQLEAGREELLTHARVLEQALESGVVLPMQFGVIMPSEEAVREELLKAHEGELSEQLDEMDGKVELNVKGVYDEDQVLRELVAENREIASLRESISGKSEDATYPERIRLGELVSEALVVKRERDEKLIVDQLADDALSVEISPIVHDRMVCNASFLVAQDRVAPFNQTLDRLGNEYEGRIRFKYTGPLPPHSFVELSLES